MKPVLSVALLVLSSLSVFGQGNRHRKDIYDKNPDMYHFSTDPKSIYSKHVYDSVIRIYNHDLVKAFNKERSKRGLPEFTYDDTKQESLTDKAIRMCKEIDKTGRCHHDKGKFAEIMLQSPDTESPDHAMELWMKSPRHKDMILSKRKDTKRICAGSYHTPEGYSQLVIRTY